MFRTHIALALAVMGLMGYLILPAAGAEVDCDSVYCFSAEDFSDREDMAGICITDLPQEMAGTLALGSRILRPGDVLTAEQVGQMTFTSRRRIGSFRWGICRFMRTMWALTRR